jgi:parallel beta-helix repeat protein
VLNADGTTAITSLNFTQSGIGAVARTVDSKLKDTVSVKDFGAVGDGVADDTVAIQNAINAASQVIIPPGIYIITQIVLKNSFQLVGNGNPTLKRKNSSLETAVILADGKNNFGITGIKVDGNLANNSIAADNISIINGSYNFTITECESISAKYSSTLGRGNGIFIQSNADSANNSRSRLASNKTNGCAVGIYARKVFNINIEQNCGSSNTFSGIKMEDVIFPASSSPTTSSIIIANNQYYSNGIGIGIFGLVSSITALGQLFSRNNYTQAFITLQSNIVSNNQYYGIVMQGSGISCTGNIVQNNGNSTANGGMLFNCLHSVCSNNVVTNNYYYGIDAGFAYNSSVSGNEVHNNGYLVNQGIGINAGASNRLSIIDNNISSNGGNLVGSYQILASSVDGTGVPTEWAPFTGFDLNISNNTFGFDNAFQTGIRVINGFSGVSVLNNTFYGRNGGVPLEVITPGPSTIVKGNTVLNSSGEFAVSATSAATTIVPDYGDIIFINGTSTIDYIRTVSQNFGLDKVIQVNMTNIGSGYTSAPTVAFSGGGGSGAAGVPAVAADGKVYGIYITNNGSGYTSAPSVTFSGGGGSGAAGTAFLNCDNAFDRIITFRFSGAAIVKNGTGNIFMSADFTGSTTKTLTLRSVFGNWVEVSRS